MDDDQATIDAAMDQFEYWRSNRTPVYVAVRHENDWMDLEGKITEVGEFVRFQDELGVVKLAFLPQMFIDVSVETGKLSTTVKCERSPYGPNLEISDIQRRPKFVPKKTTRRLVR